MNYAETLGLTGGTAVLFGVMVLALKWSFSRNLKTLDDDAKEDRGRITALEKNQAESRSNELVVKTEIGQVRGEMVKVEERTDKVAKHWREENERTRDLLEKFRDRCESKHGS